MAEPKTSTKLVKGAVVLCIVGVSAWLYFGGAAEGLDPQAVRRWLLDAGIWGALLFVVATGLLQPLHVSVYVWLVGASLVWPPPVAILLGWLGVMLAALNSFYVGRWAGKEWVDARLPARFQRYNERLETDTFKTVLTLRLIFFTTPTLQYAYGTTRVRFWPWFWAMGLGAVPYVVAVVLLGERFSEGILGWL